MDINEWKTNEYWKTVSVVVVLVFAGLATLAYALRMYAARISSGKFKVEDYLMGIGLLLSYGATVATILNAFHGVGVPSKELPHAESKSLNYGSWIIQKFWPTSMAFIKISIIFFLRSLFGARPIVRRCLDVLSVIIALWATAALLTNIFQCWPPSYYYNKNQKGHCMPGQKQFFMAMGSLALVEDTVILLIPMPTVWTLKVRLRQKIAVTLILSLGSLVCILSLLRITEFRSFILTDLSSSSALESIFTCLEMNIATICGCLPLLRPIFRKFLPSTNDSRSYGQGSSSHQPNFQSGFLSASSRNGASQFQKLSELHSSATAVASKAKGSSSERNETKTSSEIELKGIEGWTSTSAHQEVRPASIPDSNE